MTRCARLLDELVQADPLLKATLEGAILRPALVSAVTRAAHPVLLVIGSPARLVYSDAIADRLGAGHVAAFATPLAGELHLDGEPQDVLEGALRAIGAPARPGEFAVLPIPDPDGRPAGILGLGRPEGMAEANARARGVPGQATKVVLPVEPLDASMLRSVLDAIDQGCLVMNERFEVVTVNRKAAQIARRSQAQILGSTHWSLWPSSVDSTPGRMYRRVMATGKAEHVDHHYVGDGIDLWLHIQAHRVSSGIVSLFRDITRDVRLRSAEADHRARWQAARAAVGTIWTLSPAGLMTGGQPGWEATSGQRADDYQGYGWLGAIHPDDLEWTSGAFETAVARRSAFEAVTRVRRPDGTFRALRLKIVPVVRDTDETLIEWVGSCHETRA